MTNVAYFDCFAGASGDMIVASLLDAGAKLETLAGELAKLNVGGHDISASQVKRGSLGGIKFDVNVHHGQDCPHRRLDDILSVIDSSSLAERAKDRARRIFIRLGLQVRN